MIGFSIGSGKLKKILVRVVGASLVAFGISNPLLQPTLTLYSGSEPLVEGVTPGETLTATEAAAKVGAFALMSEAQDRVLLVDLPVGNYTVRVGSADGTSGQALLEIYDVP